MNLCYVNCLSHSQLAGLSTCRFFFFPQGFIYSSNSQRIEEIVSRPPSSGAMLATLKVPSKKDLIASFCEQQADWPAVCIVILFSSFLWLSLWHDKPKQVNTSNPTSNNIALWKLNSLLVYLGKLCLIDYHRCRDKFRAFVLIRPHVSYLQPCQRGASWQTSPLCLH